MKFIEILIDDLEILKEALMKHLKESHFPFEDFEYFTRLSFKI